MSSKLLKKKKGHDWDTCAEVFQMCPLSDTGTIPQMKCPCFLANDIEEAFEDLFYTLGS